jgi:hypothetical protein
VINGWHRNAGSLQLAVRRQQLLERAKRAAIELARDCIGPGQITIDNAEQPHRFSVLLELFENARVIATEGAYADHRDMNLALGSQKKVSAAGCRRASILPTRRAKRYVGVPVHRTTNVRLSVWKLNHGCLRKFGCFSLNSDGASLRKV